MSDCTMGLFWEKILPEFTAQLCNSQKRSDSQRPLKVPMMQLVTTPYRPGLVSCATNLTKSNSPSTPQFKRTENTCSYKAGRRRRRPGKLKRDCSGQCRQQMAF